MLYAIHRNNIEDYDGNQESIIYLVSEFAWVRNSNCQWVYADGHAVMELSDFYADENSFDQVDWPLMEAQYWHDRDEDNDRSRRR